MSRIRNLEDIKSVKVHWSESTVFNEALGVNKNSDIEKFISVDELKSLLIKAAECVDRGFDKISLTITLNSGLVWCYESKFYICKDDLDLLDFINKGQ